ncbi:MAG: DUF4349 domain-containing protein [Geodermatophilaceae bacterium]|nr:DUF4349 domain-containing protein [Geodermatophilaceae bacterium]
MTGPRTTFAHLAPQGRGHAAGPPARRRARGARSVWPVLILAAGLVLTGCSGGIDDATTSGADSGVAGPPVQDESGGSAEDVDTALPFAPEILDREVITTAEIRVRSEDVTRDAERAALLVDTAGGQITGDVRGGADEQQTADLVLRVPPGAVSEVLSGLAELGEELSRSVSSEDVTTIVADVDSRVQSLQASLDRLRGLIADASDITDLVTLERELAGRETELESLQAQQRALNDQVALATVTLHLVAIRADAVVDDDSTGFLAGLSDGWNAFVTVGAGLLTAVGAALPFLGLLALLGGAGVLVARRRRPSGAPAAVESA